MGLWNSIKNIGKKVINAASGFFTGTQLFNDNNQYSIGTSSTNWGQSIANLLGTAEPYLTNTSSALLGINANKEAQERQFQYNQQLQQSQQEWAERLSSTAHQREVEDLRTAGLNPLLSAGGQGASTPSSGMGTVGLTDDGQQIQNAFSNAMQVRQLKMAQEGLKSEIAKRSAETKNIEEDTETKIINKLSLPEQLEEYIKKLKSETLLNNARANASQSEVELMETQMEANRATAQYTRERDRGYSFKNPDFYIKGVKRWFNWDW